MPRHHRRARRAVPPVLMASAALAVAALPAAASDFAPGTTRIVSPAPAPLGADPWLARPVGSGPLEVRLGIATRAPGRNVSVTVNGSPVRRHPTGGEITLTRRDGLRVGQNRVEVLTRARGRVIDHDEVLLLLAHRHGGKVVADVDTRSDRAPVVVRFRAGKDTRVRRLWVNGRRADEAAAEAADGSIGLSSHDGLRRGVNRIRALVTARGVSQYTAVEVRVAGRGRLASAGRDATVTSGGPAVLGALRPAERGSPGRWRIVSAPPGSDATIARARRATARLVPDVPGEYVVERRLARGGPGSVDTATVSAHPGWMIPVSTANYQLRIGDKTYPDNVMKVVLDRQTLAPVQESQAPAGSAVVIGFDGSGDFYTYVVGQRNATYRYGYEGGALVPVGGAPGDGGLYTFTFSDYVPFQTQAGDIGGGAKGITVGGTQLATPGEGAGGFQVVAFESLTDPTQLNGPDASLYADTFATNQADRQQAMGEQEELANFLNQPSVGGQAYSAPIILLQSYGRPYADTTSISENQYLGAGIENFGGSRSVFNQSLAPGGSGTYSLVGLTPDPRAPGEFSAEASSVVFSGRPGANGSALAGGLSGVLARNTTGNLRPLSYDTVGAFTQSFLPLVFQRAEAWPAFTARQEAAARWLMWQSVSPNEPVNPFLTGDFREAYHADVDWGTALANLNRLTPQAGPGFGPTSFSAARAQLRTEFQAINDLDGLLADLKGVFYDEGSQNMSALRVAATNVTTSLKTPPQTAVNLQIVKILGDFFTVASRVAAFFPEAADAGRAFGLIGGAIAGGIDVGSASQGNLPNGNTDPISQVNTTAQNLGVQSQNAIAGQLAQLDRWRGVIVSDWGKLRQASINAEPGGDWVWEDGQTSSWTARLETAAESRFYGELLPIGYTAYSLGDWPTPGPFGSPQVIRCFSYEADDDDPYEAMFPAPDPDPSPYYEQWSYYDAAKGFHPNWWFLSRPLTPVGYHFAKDPGRMPSAALTTTLFGQDTAAQQTQLALFKPWFFERNFTPDTSFQPQSQLNGLYYPTCTSPGPQ